MNPSNEINRSEFLRHSGVAGAALAASPLLEVMNACHESQRTGRRIACETTFPWPIIKPA